MNFQMFMNSHAPVHTIQPHVPVPLEEINEMNQYERMIITNDTTNDELKNWHTNLYMKIKGWLYYKGEVNAYLLNLSDVLNTLDLRYYKGDDLFYRIFYVKNLVYNLQALYTDFLLLYYDVRNILDEYEYVTKEIIFYNRNIIIMKWQKYKIQFNYIVNHLDLLRQFIDRYKITRMKNTIDDNISLSGLINAYELAGNPLPVLVFVEQVINKIILVPSNIYSDIEKFIESFGGRSHYAYNFRKFVKINQDLLNKYPIFLNL